MTYSSLHQSSGFQSQVTMHQREELNETLTRMENNVWISYKSHFESSQYYEQLAKALETAVTVLAPTSAAAFSVTYQSILHSSANIRGIGLASSVFGLVFCALEKINKSPLHPRSMQEQHFAAGIKLSSLHKEIRAFRQIRLKGESLLQDDLMNEYIKLVTKKEDCDKIIQAETWAYVKAREQVKKFTKKYHNKQQSSQSV